MVGKLTTIPGRQRKRKCDGKMPCGTCVRYEYQCEYAPGKRQSTHHMNGDNPPELVHQQQSWPETHDVKPSVIQLQAHPLTAPGARFHHRSILDPVKTRFVRANSAIAFPRILGMDMESETIPRLHSFGWCMGIRPEEQDPIIDISTIVSWTDMQRLAAVYFAIVKPELGLLEEADFLERASARYADTNGFNELDPILLMVAALGSFFSKNPHPKEAECVRMTKTIMTWRRLSINPSPNTTATWILITIYMRCTGRCVSLKEIGGHMDANPIADPTAHGWQVRSQCTKPKRADCTRRCKRLLSSTLQLVPQTTDW